MEKKNNKTNLKDAIVDLAKGLETVFRKYSKSTRTKAWQRITSKKGEEEVRKILVDPSRQVNTFQKLANESAEEPEGFLKFSEWLDLREAKDACYHKVKQRYRVWPSAYASGALVKCRKVGAKNWGKS